MTSPIRPSGANPGQTPPTDPTAQKAIGDANAALFERLSALFKGAAAKLEGMAQGRQAPILSPEEAMELMARLTNGTHEPKMATRAGILSKGEITAALTRGKVAESLGRGEGPLAGRLLDQGVQQPRAASSGPNPGPGVPHPADLGPASVFAPFFRWMPRRKTWRQFKRWLERKLLKRDLQAAADEVYEIEMEEKGE